MKKRAAPCTSPSVNDDNSKPSGVVNAGDALRALMAEEKYEATLPRDYVMGTVYR